MFGYDNHMENHMNNAKVAPTSDYADSVIDAVMQKRLPAGTTREEVRAAFLRAYNAPIRGGMSTWDDIETWTLLEVRNVLYRKPAA